jgi:hypothetical protein
LKAGEKYEYGRIRVLADGLARAGVSQEITAQILEGAEDIERGTSPEAKAAWMGEAMHRMDKLMDRETRYAVREGCACCVGGKRLEASKAIFKQNACLEERIRAANEARFVFGHSVTLEEDGSILVRFAPEGLDQYRCVCLPKAQEPISITYCYCCGGHIKHHLQTALGRKLALQVRSSALSSGGRKPCTFSFTFAEPVA